MVVLVCGGREVAGWSLEGRERPGLAVVDELARLQLAARRVGCEIRVWNACPELCELLDLAGLAGVITGVCGSVVQVRGEAEGGEQVGVDEGVEPGDAVP
jgi:hypothetical protein